MKYYCIAGEASGDLHGSNLIRQLKLQDAQAEVHGWGGNRMEQAGMRLDMHYRDIAFMGFWEVVTHLPSITRGFRQCKSSIQSFQPDALILIDYPGFNLRMARWAHDQGLKVIYYISPQLWAWHQSRVKQIRKYVDKMIVILPFEEEFYAKHGVEVVYVGHPLLDALERLEPEPDFRHRHELDPDKPIVALLPGSRKQEVQLLLPVMAKVADHFHDYQFVVAAVNMLDASVYDSAIGKHPVSKVEEATYQLLLHAHAALVTSGTATLETALIGVPEVVCYKGGALSFWIGKRLVKVPFISLVNLIMEREVVIERIQKDVTSKKIAQELERILDGWDREGMISAYGKLRDRLGGPGASERAAGTIIDFLKTH